MHLAAPSFAAVNSCMPQLQRQPQRMQGQMCTVRTNHDPLSQSRSQSCSGGQSGLISSITVETSSWTTAERARERERFGIGQRATGNWKLDFSLRSGWVVACSKAWEALKYWWWCPKAFSLSLNVTRRWVMMTPSVKGDSDWYWNWDGIGMGMGWDGMGLASAAGTEMGLGCLVSHKIVKAAGDNL